MTPEQIATLTALASILKSIGTWPVLSVIVLVLFGPWIVLILVGINLNKRVEAQAKMYEDNVELVKRVIALAEGYRDQLTWSTQKVTKVIESVETNQFCPIVRKNSNPKDIAG